MWVLSPKSCRINSKKLNGFIVKHTRKYPATKNKICYHSFEVVPLYISDIARGSMNAALEQDDYDDNVLSRLIHTMC